MTDSGLYNKDNSIEQYSKFYKIPKKSINDLYQSSKQHSRPKKLDYQSSSAFKVRQHEPRTKIHTHIDQQSEPTKYSSHSQNRPNKWGKQVKNDKFLSDRDALDLQIKIESEKIDNILKKLG